jgi:hypothetical protein
MAGIVTAAVALTAVSVYSAVQQSNAANRQASAQRAAMEQERKMANLSAARERREQFRQARAQQGALLQTGAVSGTMGSSGLAGGMSSVSAQLGSNVSYLDSMSSMADQASIFNIEAARQGSIANQWGAVGQISGQLGGMALSRMPQKQK